MGGDCGVIKSVLSGEEKRHMKKWERWEGPCTCIKFFGQIYRLIPRAFLTSFQMVHCTHTHNHLINQDSIHI